MVRVMVRIEMWKITVRGVRVRVRVRVRVMVRVMVRVRGRVRVRVTVRNRGSAPPIVMVQLLVVGTIW